MRLAWNAYDGFLLRRTALYAALGLGLGFGVQLATDEPGSTPGMRLARLCAFTPALASVAALAALALAKEAGELASLEALGVSSWRARLAPLVAAWTLGAVATALLGTPLTDVSSLLPRLTHAAAWRFHDGVFWSPDGAVGVTANAIIRYGETMARPIAPLAERPTAVAAASAWALVVPPWLLTRMGWLGRVTGALLSLALGLVILHAVAARELSWGWAGVVTAPLAIQMGFRWRGRVRPTW